MAQILTTDLRRIGIDVVTRALSGQDLIDRESRAAKGAPWDISLSLPLFLDYEDPAGELNVVLGPTAGYFDDPAAQRQLAAAARLGGAARNRAYGRLDVELARDVAPLAAYSSWSSTDLFSARVGCQVFEPNNRMDLAALCLRTK